MRLFSIRVQRIVLLLKYVYKYITDAHFSFSAVLTVSFGRFLSGTVAPYHPSQKDENDFSLESQPHAISEIKN